MKKNDSSEAELIFSVQKGNTYDFAKLYQRYAKYACVLANKYFDAVNTGGVTRQELFTVCIESLIVAVKNFNGTGHMFYAYWKEIALRDMLKYLQENSYLMGAKGFVGLSIDNLNEAEFTCISNVLGEEDGKIYSLITYKEMTEELLEKQIITDFEQKVLNLLLVGFEVEHISKKLKCSKSRIYSTRKSLQVKLSKAYGIIKHPN